MVRGELENRDRDANAQNMPNYLAVPVPGHRFQVDMRHLNALQVFLAIQCVYFAYYKYNLI